LNKKELITALAGTERPRILVVDEQTSDDIIQEVCKAHKEHARDYDRIAKYFAGGSVYQISERLWDFCKDQLYYKVESASVQNVGCPYWILTHGVIDCKNFASFIAGVLDALKRQGLRVVWEFRFISDRVFSLFDRDPDHVFVVVNPSTQDIWVDPVLGTFNEHIYYFFRCSRRINTMGTRFHRVGAIGGITMGSACNGATMGSTAENSLLSDVAAYASGLSGAITQTQQTNLLNEISEGVLLGVATAVLGPIALIGLAALKAGAAELDKTYGVGSVSARLLTDISNLDITGLFSDVFNGRTYNTDQYWAGVYYQNYVLGNNVTDETFVSDAQVLPALKWFIDRSGVFISGREHIIALTQGANQYLALNDVNGDTTTDTALVAAAVVMAKNNWPNPGTYSSATLKSWANTVGVYDPALIALAASYGETPEQLTAQTGTQDAVAQQYVATATQPLNQLTAFLTAQSIPGVSNWILLAGMGGLIVFASTSKK
jgi:hypothetical protein